MWVIHCGIRYSMFIEIRHLQGKTAKRVVYCNKRIFCVHGIIFLGVLHTIFFIINSNPCHFEQRIWSFQTVVIINFFVISNVCIKSGIVNYNRFLTVLLGFIAKSKSGIQLVYLNRKYVWKLKTEK